MIEDRHPAEGRHLDEGQSGLWGGTWSRGRHTAEYHPADGWHLTEGRYLFGPEHSREGGTQPRGGNLTVGWSLVKGRHMVKRAILSGGGTQPKGGT